MRTPGLVAISFVAALLWTVPASAQVEPEADPAPQPEPQEVVTMEMELSGATVLPEPGPEEATGSVTLTIDAVQNLVCYTFDVEGADIASAHIHEGPEGEAGPVVLALVDEGDELEGCVEADAAVISGILGNPDSYFIQGHNEAYPAGVVRGQLSGM